MIDHDRLCLIIENMADRKKDSIYETWWFKKKYAEVIWKSLFNLLPKSESAIYQKSEIHYLQKVNQKFWKLPKAKIILFSSIA